MSHFCEVLTQFSEYMRMTNGRRMVQIGPNYLPPNLNPERFYDLMLPMVRGNIEQSRAVLRSSDRVAVPVQIETMGTVWLAMNMEAKWYSMGAPEYKIHPGMVEALAHTKLDIPGHAVQLPFPCFVIRLPHHHLREAPGKPWVETLLVSEIYEQQLGATRRKFCMLVDFEPPSDSKDPFEYSIMSKFELDTSEFNSINVSECVNQMPLGGEDNGYWPDREMTIELVALAISTALLAIGNDRTHVKQGSVSSVERVKRDKIIKRHGSSAAGTDKPFEVGADIKLPRQERNYGSKSDSEESGRQLKWSHIQSGYIRVSRCKDDNGDIVWRPRFIRPSVHRPDLPMRPRTTPRAVMTPEAARGNG